MWVELKPLSSPYCILIPDFKSLQHVGRIQIILFRQNLPSQEKPLSG